MTDPKHEPVGYVTRTDLREVKRGCLGYIAPARTFQPENEVAVYHSDDFEALTAQLDALKEENERLRVRWMPIETAPRDGTPILAFGPEPVSEPSFLIKETRWEFYGKGSIAHADFVAGKGPSGGWGWHEPVMNWGCKWKPTHWMPCPKPPTALTQPQLPESRESVEGGE